MKSPLVCSTNTTQTYISRQESIATKVDAVTHDQMHGTALLQENNKIEYSTQNTTPQSESTSTHMYKREKIKIITEVGVARYLEVCCSSSTTGLAIGYAMVWQPQSSKTIMAAVYQT